MARYWERDRTYLTSVWGKMHVCVNVNTCRCSESCSKPNGQSSAQVVERNSIERSAFYFTWGPTCIGIDFPTQQVGSGLLLIMQLHGDSFAGLLWQGHGSVAGDSCEAYDKQVGDGSDNSSGRIMIIAMMYRMYRRCMWVLS